MPATQSFRAMLLALLVTLLLSTVAGAASFPPLPGDPPPAPGEDPRSPRPNIVVLVLDDIPQLDGRLLRKLPNIKRYFLDE
ncbi:MAG: hypothetical protein ACC726_08285, partial [Chloroflexota bacterium]